MSSKTVRLKTTVAGPEWSGSVDQVVTIDAKEADDLVAGGYAELFVFPEPGAVETATVQAPENTLRRPASRKAQERKSAGRSPSAGSGS